MADNIGLYNPVGSLFFLRDSLSAGPANLVFDYGPPLSNWTPLTGKWGGGATDGIGLYDPTSATFFLKGTLGSGSADLSFQYGPGGAGWAPLAGDWDGDGDDTVGLYNSTTGTFFLRNTNSAGAADTVVQYGPGGAGWVPVVGDWDGDGDDTVGLYNSTTGAFFLKNTNVAGPADITFTYGPGGAGWVPVVGDWDGDGDDTIGLYNQASGTYYLRDSNTSGVADYTFDYGPPASGWAPLVGDWGTLPTLGQTFTLTTAPDTIPGLIGSKGTADTSGDDIIQGTFGWLVPGTNTYSLNDNIDGGAGYNVLNLNTIGAGPSTNQVVKNVQTINITDNFGATFDALNVQGGPAINWLSTLDGNTSSVINGDLASRYGLQGKGDLTVDFASTAGASTALLDLMGVGTSATNRSLINVSDGNGIESVNIATSGTNFFTLNAGNKAAQVTLTGNGTNSVDMATTGFIATTVTVDASATTGDNQFLMGANLSTTDTLMGGTAWDRMSATIPNAITIAPDLSGIEQLDLTFNAAGTLSLLNSSDVEQVNLLDSAGDMAVTNADMSLTQVNMINHSALVDPDVRISYRAGVEGNLDFTIGSDDPLLDGNFDLADIYVTRVANLAVNAIGTSDHSAGTLYANDALDVFDINIGDNASFNFDADVNGSIGELNIDVGQSGYYSGDIGTTNGVEGDIGQINVHVDDYGSVGLDVMLSGGNGIGGIHIVASGAESTVSGQFTVEEIGSQIGDITASAIGQSAYIYMGVEASGGTIGNVTLLVNGEGAAMDVSMSAGDWEGTNSGSSPLGGIGDIDITVRGADANFSGDFNVSGGDIGNIRFDIDGNGASASLYASAVAESRDLDADVLYDDYFGGGQIGSIDIRVANDATLSAGFAASGGGIGDISLTLENSANLNINVSAGTVAYSGAPIAEIDSLTVDVIGNDNWVSGSFYASGGSIGDVLVNVYGNDNSGNINLQANWVSGHDPISNASGYIGGGDIGNITVMIDGERNDIDFPDVLASGGNIGNVVWSQFGDTNSGEFNLHANYTSGGNLPGHGGRVGDITVTLGDDQDFSGFVGADVAIGAIHFTIGDNSSAAFGYSGGGAADAGYRSVGDMTVDLGADSSFNFSGAWSGDVGAISITGGNNSIVDFQLEDVSGYVQSFTLAGGNQFASAYVEIDSNGIDVVDASAWMGELQVDLSGGTLGTTIIAGQGDSVIHGTNDADEIYLGAGWDTVQLDNNTVADEVFDFTILGTKHDDLDVNDATAYRGTLTANPFPVALTLVNGDVVGLIEFGPVMDLTTEAGLLTALNGGYNNVNITAANTATIWTATATTSTDFYVYEAADDGDAIWEAGELTLVGVVHADSAVSNLTLTNFV